MAATDELTAGFRRRTLALRAVTLRDLIAIWAGYTVDDIDRSWDRIEPAVLALTELRFRDSVNLAAAYYLGHRAAAGVVGTPNIVRTTFDRTRARNNLTLLGPILTKKAVAARRPRPEETALVRVSGEVTRLTLEGGRETIRQTVNFDRRAVGWRRVTSTKPCPFCQLLAGRGAVYRESTADFQSHPHCSCQPEPAYTT